MKTPLTTVKERFGSKDKLIEALKEFTTEKFWVDRLSSDRGGSKGLKNVSNAKLLKLYDTFSQVKEQFGDRVKLIDALLEVQKRVADAGYRTRLEAYPVTRLLDLYQSAKKRVTAKAKKAAK